MDYEKFSIAKIYVILLAILFCFKTIVMKQLIPVLLIGFISSFAIAQQEWEVFTPITECYEIEFHDNKAFAATDGGLLIIDLESCEETLFTSNNSGIKGYGVKDIEILSDGRWWLRTQEAGLIHFDGSDYFHIYDDSVDWVNIWDLTTHNTKGMYVEI